VKTFRDTLSILAPVNRRKVYGLLVLAAVIAVVEAASVGLLYPLLELLTAEPGTEPSTVVTIAQTVFGTTETTPLAWRMGVAILILFVLGAALGILATWRQARLVADSEAEVSSRLFGAYLRAPYLYHVNRNSSEMLRNTVTACADVHNMVLLPYLILVGNLVAVVIVSTVIILVSPVVIIATICYFGVVAFLYLRVVNVRAERAGAGYHRTVATVLRLSQEGFGGLKSLQTFDTVENAVSEYDRSRRVFADYRQQMNYYSQLPQYYLQAALILGVVLFVGVAVAIGIENPTALVALLLAAAIRLMPSIYTSLTAVNRIRNGRAGLTDLIADVRELTSDVDTDADADAFLLAPAPAPAPFSDAIEFDDVSFAYDDGTPALRGVSFRIGKGDAVGLVGSSGAGKTTVVDLLLGLFRPSQGAIRIDGVELTAENVGHWRRQIGYVPQDIFLIDGTITDNIRFGRSLDGDVEARVWRALEQAQLAEFIRSLPQGLDTVVGEKGVRLSGGQRQRLGIARALYGEPKVLILDEATSALDTSTESAVAETIATMRHRLTLVTVAHRLSTVQDSDVLILLDGGTISAMGDFETLRRESRQFARLAELARIGSDRT
jgi:ATP-binding cassette subfamily C protein